MNITNVVLDRDKRLVTFDTAYQEGIVHPVTWIRTIGWLSDRYCESEGSINELLKDVELDGLSLENLSMRIESKPDQVKQERYLKADGTDTIDKWAATRSIDAFRVIMFAQIEKYNDRLGKKDPILEEVTKMADYMNRWVEYEKIWDKEDAE